MHIVQLYLIPHIMISKPFNFQNFVSKKNYCKLLNELLSQDYKGSFVEPISEPIETATIIIYSRDEFSGEENYDQRDLRTHFLIPGINQLRSYHYRIFIHTINTKALYMPEQKEGLAKTYFDKINETVTIYDDATYLDNELKSLLVGQLEMLREDVERYISNPYPNIKSKLQFNWSRAEILVFFNLLRTSGSIAWMEDSDMGRIIDYVCEFKGDDKYLPINNSRKHLTEYKNNKRSQESALKKIQGIFSSNEFYGLK